MQPAGLLPEQQARSTIDAMLAAAGWSLQHRESLNLAASDGPTSGVAVREFPLKTGYADYLLFVGRKAIGAVEAKAVGTPLSGVEAQSAKYSTGLKEIPLAWRKPLPFLYESTGVETFFTNGLDPEPRSRRVFSFHRPETLRAWVAEPETFRARLRSYPPLDTTGLWPAQVEAITSLEASLAQDRPRALIQMATGSGKTFTAVGAVYRLLQQGGAHRALFLVDRANLGRQALREFQQYPTPDDGRTFTELYNVQHLTSNTLDAVSKVHITTIQRLYSILSGEQSFDAELEEGSLFEVAEQLGSDPRAVRYNPAVPPEYYDVIVIDECHRSIYNVWRQALEYFDAYLIGLTATPYKQTIAFFNQNLVMEYSRQRAVVDGVNVDGQVYRIRTQITEAGSTVVAGEFVGRRNRLTRQERLQELDEDLVYSPAQLDREVVTPSQIRTVIRAFRDRLFTEIFPGRTETPKTLIFAKDDAHAEEIVRIVREEFARGNEFCQKITYKVTGQKPEDLIAAFRNSYNPRVAVTVDMIATGTDIRPLEVLLFMRLVKSRGLFEQMLGRGTRIISPTDLRAVTPDARAKTHFVLVDAVGTVEHPKVETGSLDRKPSIAFEKLLEALALGATDDDTLSSLASRLVRLEATITPPEAYTINTVSGGLSPRDLARALLDAIDPDACLEEARRIAGGAEPDAAQQAQAAAALLTRAVAPFDNPDLRGALIAAQRRGEQTLDTVSVDVLREAAFSTEATAAARATVESFRHFIEEHRDELTALRLLYEQPYSRKALTFAAIKELATRLEQPPRNWTPQALWQAYAQVERGRVRGAGATRVLTDLVSLVRHALWPEGDLAPFPELVRGRYAAWLAAQQAAGRAFTPEQLWWLDRIAAYIGVNLAIEPADLMLGGFLERGGQLSAIKAFGQETLHSLLDELNTALAA